MLLRYAQYKGVVNLDICEMQLWLLVVFHLSYIHLKNKRFLTHEVEATKTITNLRIHVEKEMKRIKNFRILTGVVPITLASQASKSCKICV